MQITYLIRYYREASEFGELIKKKDMSDSEAEQHKLYWALLAKVWVFPGVFIDPVLDHLLS